MDMEQNHEDITNPSSERALVIKLKMAKEEEEVPFSDIQGNRKPETLAPPRFFTRMCHLCKRGFESGKALGGHIRMHAQESKGLINKSSLKYSSKPKSSTSSSISTNDEHVCIECSKVFPSKKSLYGHMRSHPDRPYRGIEPPPSNVVKSAKNSSTSTLSDANLPHNNDHKAAANDDQLIDSAATARVCFGENPKPNVLDVPNMTRVMPSWRKTSKRGRKDSSFDEEEELDMSEAVKDLMMFAQTNPTKVNNNRMGLDLGYESEEEFSDNETCIVIANVMNKRQRKKMKLEDLNSKAMALDHHDQKVYTCSLCSKSFQSHQALGGHVSSHNKIKNKENYSSEHDDDHQCGLEDTTRDQGESHQCRICNKIFQTGQALGGHMRSHWNGPNEQDVSSQMARKGLGIDLNEAPPMEYDDQQGVDCNYGAGYATSYDSVTLR